MQSDALSSFEQHPIGEAHGASSFYLLPAADNFESAGQADKAPIGAALKRAGSGLDQAGANAGLSPVRKRFHQFSNGLDEHLRDRAERPVLQGSDADRLSNVGQFHGQCLKSGMFARQEE
jgi:hypothetical protein